MDLRHLEELSAVEGHYWWNVGKTRLVRDLLARFAPAPGQLVEGGVGACGNLRGFRDAGYDVLGLDASPEAAAHGVAQGLDVRVHDLVDAWPVISGSARAVVLLDVIEHLDDPVRALERARDALAPEGVLIVTVPAYPWLHGPWDEMLGHRRRYTRSLVVAQAAEAGLRPIWVSHWNLVALPAALVLRTAQRLAGAARGAEFPKVPRLLNEALERAMAVERRWLRVASVPAGMSLVGVFSR